MTQPKEGKTEPRTIRVVDAPTTDDLLGFARFAQPLSERVASATKENTPLTIGVYGEWGSGKTSFLMMVDRSLRKQGIYPIWFNAWKYDQEDNLWAALIQTILDQAHVSGKWYRRVLVKVRLRLRQVGFQSGTRELTRTLVVVTIRLTVFLLSAGLLLGWSVQDISQAITSAAGSLFPGDPVFVAFIVKAVIAVVAVIAAKPESLLKLFDAKLGIDYSKLSKKQSYRDHIAFLDRFNDEFEDIVDKISLGSPLVVIIDDLDRCLPEKAVQVLEAIKLFLDVRNCVFLLAVDRDVIERAISVKYKDLIELLRNENGESSSLATFLGENYFEKIIQLPFSLPPMGPDDIEHLVTQLSPATEADQFSSIFAVGLQRNPRKVKRVLQIFFFLRDMANERIREGAIKLPLLAKLVIIQNRFRTLYAEIVESPEILSQLELYFRIVDEYHHDEHAQKASSLDDYVTEVGGIGPALREKLEVFATEYAPLGPLLLLSTDEHDTFANSEVADYIYFVKTISDAELRSEAVPSDESEGLLVRRYLRYLLETTKYFSAQGITQEARQSLQAQIISFRFGKYSSSDADSAATPLPLKSIIQTSVRILILGDPGSGKTTLLNYLASTHADSTLRNDDALVQDLGFRGSLLPVLLPLSNFRRRYLAEGKPTPSALIEFVKDHLELSGISQSAIQTIHRYMERGQCLILFDGLDEVPEDLRYTVAESINTFLARYPSNICFVTMRTHGFEAGVQLIGFEPFQILPWDEEQAIQFVRNWFSDSPDKAERLLAAIASNQEIANFSRNPILMTILANTFDSYGKLPERREDLIESFVEIVLGRWDQARGIDLGAGFNTRQLRQALMVVARKMQETNQSSIRKTSAVSIIVEETDRDVDEASKMLDVLVARSGLLIEIERNNLMFVHRIVQEYFANLE